MQQWYDKIETKRVSCRICGAKFLTRLAPNWTEHKICLDCEEDLRDEHNQQINAD